MVCSVAWNGRGGLVVDPEKDQGLRGAKRTVRIDLITLQNRSVDGVTSAFMQHAPSSKIANTAC